MPSPDFFLVGHPRSGSGQLNGYLAKHPQLFMAKKELHYFGSDLGYHVPGRTLENYLSYFEGGAGKAHVGEASTWYLFSERAAAEIHEFCRGARILVLLRNPVDMLHSLHSHFVFRGDEDIADFGEALAAEPDRRAGRRQPPHTIPQKGLWYREIVRYASQLRRYFDRFGRERVLVIINDDFRKDARAEFRRACALLEVNPEVDDAVFAPDKRSENANRTVRSRALQDFLIRPGQQQVLEGVRRGVPGHQFMLRAIRRLNIRYVERNKMDPELRHRLSAELLPEVEELSQLLDRDLTGWCRF